MQVFSKFVISSFVLEYFLFVLNKHKLLEQLLFRVLRFVEGTVRKCEEVLLEERVDDVSIRNDCRFGVTNDLCL